MLLHADGQPMTIEAIPFARALRSGTTTARQELQIVRADGTTMTVLLNRASVRSDDGKIVGAVAVFQDISRIKDAEQLSDGFLALISHELRTPLTTIQGGRSRRCVR